jgi:nitrite reductase/ring-hydroxylating ferredoxin subunit
MMPEENEIADELGTYVGVTNAFQHSDRLLTTLDGVDIGIFKLGTRYVAYENTCAHQGGPVCTGVLIGKVEAVLEGTRLVGERFSQDEIHLVCPWHGVEYRLNTGQCASDEALRLRSFEVVERNGGLYVRQ